MFVEGVGKRLPNFRLARARGTDDKDRVADDEQLVEVDALAQELVFGLQVALAQRNVVARGLELLVPLGRRVAKA